MTRIFNVFVQFFMRIYNLFFFRCNHLNSSTFNIPLSLYRSNFIVVVVVGVASRNRFDFFFNFMKQPDMEASILFPNMKQNVESFMCYPLKQNKHEDEYKEMKKKEA